MKAVRSGSTLTSEPKAMRLKTGLPPADELTLFQTLSPSVSGYRLSWLKTIKGRKKLFQAPPEYLPFARTLQA